MKQRMNIMFCLLSDFERLTLNRTAKMAQWSNLHWSNETTLMVMMK